MIAAATFFGQALVVAGLLVLLLVAVGVVNAVQHRAGRQRSLGSRSSSDSRSERDEQPPPTPTGGR